MKKIVSVAIALTAGLVLAGFGVWCLMSSPTAYSGTTESISIGSVPLDQYVLIYVARDQGFFSANGLNVTLKDYDTGPAGIDGMEKDEVNISISAEYPFVREALNGKNISVFGSIDRFQSQVIICRRDRGIVDHPDLRGKRIGVLQGTILEFYLGRFLNLHGISLQDVHLVNIPTSQNVDAIANGSVDAVIIGDKYIEQIKERLGNNIEIWPAQSSQMGYSVMACKNSWAASHPESINRFLKSLGQAEEYTIDHPDEAKEIVQKKFNYSDEDMATVWSDNQFSLSLDQSLLVAMEDEGRWTIANNMTTEKTLPNFREFIYTKGLEEVKPESVNVIG